MRLEDVAPIAISFVIIGVALGIGANITQQTTTALLTPQVVTNETITFTNLTVHAISNAQVTSIISVSNQTTTYTAGNYTLSAGPDGSGLNITISCGGPGAASSGNCTGIGSTLNVSFNVNSKTSASNAASNATSGIGTVGSWLPTIGLIVAAAVIIGILFSSFYGRRQE